MVFSSAGIYIRHRYTRLYVPIYTVSRVYYTYIYIDTEKSEYSHLN